MSLKTQNRPPLALVAAALLTCAWGASGAIAKDEVRSEKVSLKDLNRDTPEGVQAIYGRIHSAAQHVCAETELSRLSLERACITKAEDEAIEKVNLSTLTAYYNAKVKTGKHAQPLVASR